MNYCMPPAASRIKDVEAKYYVALRLSVYRDVGAIIAANPSTMLGIARLGDREKETLIRDLADGTIDPKWAIPTEVRRRRSASGPAGGAGRPPGGWKRSPSRPAGCCRRTTGPTCEFLANWTGGTMGAYLRQYPEYFGETPIRDPGLIASEGRMTIPIDDGTPAGMLDYPPPLLRVHPRGATRTTTQPETVEAADLIEGRRYFILLTTAGGLYRYQIRDLVRCVGFEGKAPLLDFLNKGSHFSSLTGEKLSEFQVVAAADEVQQELGHPPRARSCCCPAGATRPTTRCWSRRTTWPPRGGGRPARRGRRRRADAGRTSSTRTSGRRSGSGRSGSGRLVAGLVGRLPAPAAGLDAAGRSSSTSSPACCPTSEVIGTFRFVDEPEPSERA